MKANLLNFSEFENTNSKFTAELQERGGNITFSNSGKGGNKKFFSLSLETFLSCLKDIKKNISEFKDHESYVEKDWRDLGSKFFKDGPANAQITVQTKPMFTTLSKIIMWANSLSLNDIDPEKFINLETSKIDQAIKSLDELTESFSPVNSTSLNTEILEISSSSIRDFAIMVFQYFYENDWESLFNESILKDASINEKKYKIYDHEWFKNLIGVFDHPQDKSSLSSSNTIRYFEEPIYVKGGNYYHFSTQWNANGEYNLTFKNLKRFIEDRFPYYLVVHEGKNFKLISGENKRAEISQDLFKLSTFKADCETSGLKYSDQLITRYIASLTTKPFVLLTGLSGSGKTKLAQSFAQWISESKEQYCIVPVGADWTNREPLLGYVNALDDTQYISPENGALTLILNANTNQHKPYFLILDEMNLSHVERYFADFLSVMESKDKFKLHNDSILDKSGIPHKLSWPKNLFVVGTVNIDETTYMFSPKVLDRANVIEFRVDENEIEKFLKESKKITSIEGFGKTMGTSFVNIALGDPIHADLSNLNDELLSFFADLKKLGAEFGYRTGSEIQSLFSKIDLIDPSFIHKEDEKIDIGIMQKLLPKLHGSRRKLIGTLEVLAEKCLVTPSENIFNEKGESLIISSNIKYKLSFEKISRMYKGLIDNGFTSYAEA